MISPAEDAVSVSGVSIKWKPRTSATALALIVASLGEFSMGTVLTFSAPVLVDTEFQNRFPDVGNGSWFAGAALLGALLSAAASGILNAKFGRRGTMLITALPFAVGWGMIAFAPNIMILYAGRFITGFCGGTFTATVPQYISEVSEDNIRGALAVVFVSMNSSGILFTLALGAYMNWFALTLVCGCVPMMSFVGMLYVPESPRYLIRTKKPAEARQAIQWLRRAPSERCIEPEFSKLEISVLAERRSGQTTRFASLLSLRVLKPVGIIFSLMFFAHFSGIIGVALFTVQIFEEAETGIDANLISILLGAANVLTELIVPLTLVEKLGRRALLIISELAMFLSLIALGVFFFLKELNFGESPESLKWLPAICLTILTIGFNAGPGTISWVITAEMLPNDVKEMTTSFVCMWYWLLFLIAGKSFQITIEMIGYAWKYWISAAICLIGAIFVYFLIPETKGKSADEIEKFFISENAYIQRCPDPQLKNENSGSTSSGMDNSSFVNINISAL